MNCHEQTFEGYHLPGFWLDRLGKIMDSSTLWPQLNLVIFIYGQVLFNSFNSEDTEVCLDFKQDSNMAWQINHDPTFHCYFSILTWPLFACKCLCYVWSPFLPSRDTSEQLKRQYLSCFLLESFCTWMIWNCLTAKGCIFSKAYFSSERLGTFTVSFAVETK